jgi:mannose-6-phosphate isomerase-like protein (cupin superfamily)
MDEKSRIKEFKSRFTDARETTQGQKSEGFLSLEPFEKGPPEHIHTKQTEYFEVLLGELSIKLEAKIFVLKEGEKIQIEKGQAHTYFNDTNEKVEARFTYEPALNIQWMLDTLESNDKKNGGDWNRIPIFETGYILFNLRDEYRLAKLPFWLQDVFFGTISTFAKILGISKKIKFPENLNAF